MLKQDALVRQSLEQYRLAVGIFDAMLASLKEAPPAAGDAACPGKENGSSDAAASNGSAESVSKGTGSSNGKGKGEEEGGATKKPPPAMSAIEELEDVRDAIRETIDTMVSGKDMEALAEYKSGAGSTTVGFGDPSPPSAFSGGGGGSGGGAAGEVTTVGFGAPSGAAAAAATVATGFGGASATGFGGASATAFAPPGVRGGTAANVMVVKRKGRPAPKAGGASGPPPAKEEGATASPKKAKASNE